MNLNAFLKYKPYVSGMSKGILLSGWTPMAENTK
jgi:hypothetical protein